VRRPDHPSGYRLLAFALARDGSFPEAFEVLSRALSQGFAPRFGNARALLSEDLALVAAAWAGRAPEAKSEVEGRLDALHVRWAASMSLRFVVTWESDTSDVDLLLKVGERRLDSKTAGYDIRDGYGPEAIIFRDGSARPDRLGVFLSRRGFQ